MQQLLLPALHPVRLLLLLAVVATASALRTVGTTHCTVDTDI